MTRKDLFDKAKAAGMKIQRHISFVAIHGPDGVVIQAWHGGWLKRGDSNCSRALYRQRLSPDSAAKWLGLNT